MSYTSRLSDDSPLLKELQELLGERLSLAPAVREQHGKDESFHPPYSPTAVAFAHSTIEVSAIVKRCAHYQAPIIPFGTGTSLEGHVAALYGGICIDVSQMNAILKVNPEDLDCTVQAGVTRKQLNQHLRDTGLFFPIDPGADASLGGMTATRASGTNAVRYGTMRENVLSLTAVMADGKIIRTAKRSRKSSAGYDLTRLLVGSEGTLGVITEVSLRLYGIPEATAAAVCSFPSVEAAVNTVILTIQSGIPIARIELADSAQMAAFNLYSDLNYPELPHLFLEFHGSPSSVREQSQAVQDIAQEFGGTDFNWTVAQEDRNRLWQARHNAAYACKALKPGHKLWATDVCVPISRLAECIVETQQDIEQSTLTAPIVGHVGDGNFHLCILVDPDNSDHITRATELNNRLVARALAMEGTCTGEHGIGYGKIDFLKQELGAAVETMAVIKKALDPANIMNPGKILRGS